ncbi:hypothetical protein D3C71_2108410 [compost metagenome]
MARKRNKEELTEKMHSEFSVSPDQDRKHIVWTVLDLIRDGVMKKSEAMEAYGVSESEIEKFEEEFNEMKDE